MSGEKSYPRRHRIASLIRRALSPIVAQVCDPAVTVRRVSLNGDYSVATVHYAMLAGDAAAVKNDLQQKATLCRKRLAAELNMRATPQLVFTPDHDGIAADSMEKLLDGIAAAAAKRDSLS